MITIRGKALGKRKPLFADFSVPPPRKRGDGDGPLTLRTLIKRVVTSEFRALEKRQDAQRLDRVRLQWAMEGLATADLASGR